LQIEASEEYISDDEFCDKQSVYSDNVMRRAAWSNLSSWSSSSSSAVSSAQFVNSALVSTGDWNTCADNLNGICYF